MTSEVYAGATDATEKKLTIGQVAGLLPILTVAYGLGFAYLRGAGEIYLIFALLPVVVSLTNEDARAVALKTLPLAVFGGLVLVLSFARVMPPAWTVHYETFVAIRQYSWMIFLPALIVIFYDLFSRHYEFIERNSLALLVFSYIASRFSRSSDPLMGSDLQLHGFYTFTNENAICVVLFMIFLFRRRRPLVLDIVLALCGLALATSAQSQIVMLSILLVRVFPDLKLTHPLLFIAVAIGYLVAPYYAYDLHAVDPNTGIRAMFWLDAINAMTQSWGAGVGFGTEYITNVFSGLKHTSWVIVPEDDPGRLYVGTHSAFFDVGLRTGVIGLALFSWWFFFATRPVYGSGAKTRRLSVCLTILVVSVSATNMSFASMNFLVGTAMCLALLAFLRARTKDIPSAGVAPAA